MKGVRLITARLLVSDLAPSSAKFAASFHRRNKEFHQRWDPARVDDYYTTRTQRRILRSNRRAEDSLLLWLLQADGGCLVRPLVVVGAITLSSITRGALQSCYLGYKLDSTHTRQGYMHEALVPVLDYVFGPLGLHRVEANVMPGNERSMQLVGELGFADEGLARSYLRIQDRWEDHRHMVMLREQWLPHRA